MELRRVTACASCENPPVMVDAKIKTPCELETIVGEARSTGRRVVFANGCFDVLHRGHLALLREARRLGDLLIVAVNGDASVRALKGPGRPVNPRDDRMELLAALETVDYVTCFANTDPYDIICRLNPDVLVKGADWSREEVPGGDVVERNGGEVVILPRVPDYSSTELIERIRRR